MPHNSNGIDWNKYKNEILDLHSKGNGSSSIVDILEDSYGKFPSKNPSRQIRKIIARVKPDSIIDESLHRNNIAPNSWKVAWVKDAETGTSTLVKNTDFKDEVVDYDLLKDEMREEMNKYSKKVPKYNRKPTVILSSTIQAILNNRYDDNWVSI